MILHTRAASPFYKNGFVAACEDTREAILIDPGDEIAELIDVIRKEHLAVRHILLTHAHMDHVSGVAEAKRATGAPIGVHRDDLFLYNSAVEQGEFFGYTLEQPPPPDFFYEPNQRMTVGRYVVDVHHTPGHSPGGVCLLVTASTPRIHAGPAHVFAGDTLFAGSIGRTDLPGGDYDTLLSSIRNVVFEFGDDAIVHPGHGPDTTVGDERHTNPFLKR
ncbi:MAG: MBL fold metallo-hydrolase [Acidobacteria bacterium]|nr:MBL fold metallo-hydrolase [Acidobacteriota bacterium]